MKKSLNLMILGLALAGLAVAAEKVAIVDLVKTPEKYDGKVVKIMGKVDEFRQRTSKAGNDYYTAKVSQNGKIVNVYGQGKLEKAPEKGDSVEAIGKFAKEKKVSDTFTAKNELNVTKNDKDEKTKEFGLKILN